MSRTVFSAGLAALLLGASSAGAAELAVSITIPRLEVAEYHRPYVAVWVERADQSVAANLAVWYANKNNNEGTKWLSDLRQWWRRSGRELTLPIDGVTGATRPVGQHQLKFDSAKGPLAGLAVGSYSLVVEAVREVGGREVVKLPFTWPATAAVRASESGKTELGAVSLQITP